MLKQIFVLLLLTATAFAEIAYFSFATDPDAPFVVKLIDEDQIKHARSLLNWEEDNIQTQIAGKIVKGRIEYNCPYSYYFDPKTIRFFDNANTSCNFDFETVNDDIEKACTDEFLPDCYMCPERSGILDEIWVGDRPLDDQKIFRAGGKYWSNGDEC